MSDFLKRFLMALFGDVIPELIKQRNERKAREEETKEANRQQEIDNNAAGNAAGRRYAAGVKKGLENERNSSENRH